MILESGETLKNEKAAKTVEILKERNIITYSQFEKWVHHFKLQGASFLNDLDKKIQQIEVDFLEKQRIEQITFGDAVPQEMTAAKYLIMYKMIWASIRHEMWKAIEKKSQLEGRSLSRQELEQIYYDEHNQFEQIRLQIYAKVMEDPDITRKQAKRNMQMCYCMNASHTPDPPSTWPYQVRAVTLEHTKLCNEILAGKYYRGIQKDPRDEPLANLEIADQYKTDLSQWKSMLPERYSRPRGDNVEKYI